MYILLIFHFDLIHVNVPLAESTFTMCTCARALSASIYMYTYFVVMIAQSYLRGAGKTWD